MGGAVGGVLLVVAYTVGRQLAIDQVDGPEGRAAAGAVWDAVRRLPDRQRSIVVLHYVDQLSTAEIGDLLGLSASTVQTHLARSRDRLAVLLEATLPDATPRKEGDHR